MEMILLNHKRLTLMFMVGIHTPVKHEPTILISTSLIIAKVLISGK